MSIQLLSLVANMFFLLVHFYLLLILQHLMGRSYHPWTAEEAHGGQWEKLGSGQKPGKSSGGLCNALGAKMRSRNQSVHMRGGNKALACSCCQKEGGTKSQRGPLGLRVSSCKPDIHPSLLPLPGDMSTDFQVFPSCLSNR